MNIYKAKLDKTYIMTLLLMSLMLFLVQIKFFVEISFFQITLKILFMAIFIFFLLLNKIKKRDIAFALIISFILFVFSIIQQVNILMNYKDVSIINSLKSMANLTIKCFYVASMLKISKSISEHKNEIAIYLVFIIVLSLACLIYPFIFELDNLIKGLTSESSHNYQITSLFNNKNTFGLILFLGSISSLYLANKKTKLYLLLSLLFTLMLFVCHSKTPMFLSGILLLINYMYFLFKNKNLSLKEKKIKLIVNCALISTLIVSTILILGFSKSLRETLFNFISNSIIKDGLVTIKDRFNKYSLLFKSLSIFEFIFGLGINTSQSILLKKIGALYVDNYYISILVFGGLILEISLLYLSIKFLKKTSFKGNQLFVFTLLTSMAIYGLFESASIINLSVFFLPIFIMVLSLKHFEIDKRPLRILQIGVTYNYGGIEKVVYDLFSGLDKNQIIFDFINTFDKPLAYEEQFEKNGSIIYKLDLKKKGRYLKYLYELIMFFKHNKFDGVMYQFGDLSNASMMIIPYLCGVKHISYFAHMDDSYVKYSIITKIRIFISKFITYILNDSLFAISSKASKFTYIKTNKVHYLTPMVLTNYDFSELSRKEIRDKYNVTDKDILIGNIGLIIPRKNQKKLIEVFALFSKKVHNSKLILVGPTIDHEYLQSIYKQVEKFNLNDKVIITGSINNNIEKYYSAFDVFVFTSISESFGLVLVEAQANGLGVLCSKEIECPDIEASNRIAFINLVNDNNLWAEQISTLLKMRLKNGHDLNNAERFDNKKCAKQMTEIILDAIGGDKNEC